MINWTKPNWAYLLGVVHGDGHIAKRSISISVGYKDRQYCDVIYGIWESLGYSPKIYFPRSAIRIDVHNIQLRNVFSQYKKKGIWRWPKKYNISEYLSGVFDTDGYASLSNTSSGISKQIGITLKRSGNLFHIAELLKLQGIEGIKVRRTTSTYDGRSYGIEIIQISASKRIVQIYELLNLRNARKAEMFRNVYDYSKKFLDHIPLWKEVGLWIQKEGAKTWREIATEFNLSKNQVDSLLQNLRKYATIEKIPPVTTKYVVKDL